MPPSGHRRTVAVLAPRDPRRLARLTDLSEYDGDDLVVLSEDSSDALHDRLRRLATVDEVVDARVRRVPRQWRRWIDLFLHLRPGGRWVTLRPEAPDGFAAGVRDLVAEPTGRRRREVASAVAGVEVEGGRVVIVKQGEHLLKVRDAEVDPVLTSRAPDLAVTVLERTEPCRVDLSGRVRSHGFLETELAEPLHVPPLHLRRYEGRIELPGGAVVRHGSTLLPETYRWHLHDNPLNKRLVDIDARWARTRRPEPPEQHLEGSYYNLDYNNPGHFGHLMSDAVSRLWGWPTAKAADPDLRVLCRRSPRDATSSSPRLETVLLPAFGIDLDDVVWVDRPVGVECLVGATPMWHNREPYFAHPGLVDVWARLRDGLPAAEVAERPRIFVTRSGGHRRCHDQAAVEAFFADHGFAIVSPETMPLPEQAATFGRASVVAGFGGSGMFNLMWTRALEAVVVLSHTAYDARNEHLMTSVLGAEGHFFWGRPDIQHPPGGWSKRAFKSPWTFDLEARRDELSAVLRRLG